MRSGAGSSLNGSLSPLDYQVAALSAALRGFGKAGVRSVLVTSAHRGEGSTTVAMIIARALKTDQRVLLVDANLRHPRLHRHYATSISPGLADVLSDGADAGKVARTADEHLSILPSGTISNEATKPLLDPARMKNQLESMERAYDVVVIDSAAGLEYPDPIVLAPLCDGVVIVVEAGGTRWEVAGDLKARLEEAGARLLGIVMNKKRLSIPGWIYRRV